MPRASAKLDARSSTSRPLTGMTSDRPRRLSTSDPNTIVVGEIVEALRCKAEGRSEVILFNLCGHGHFDMSAYSTYFAGKLVDQQYDEAELAMALAGLPSVPA